MEELEDCPAKHTRSSTASSSESHLIDLEHNTGKYPASSHKYKPNKAKNPKINDKEEGTDGPGEPFTSTAIVKVRHASRGQIKNGKVSDITKKLEAQDKLRKYQYNPTTRRIHTSSHHRSNSCDPWDRQTIWEEGKRTWFANCNSGIDQGRERGLTPKELTLINTDFDSITAHPLGVNNCSKPSDTYIRLERSPIRSDSAISDTMATNSNDLDTPLGAGKDPKDVTMQDLYSMLSGMKKSNDEIHQAVKEMQEQLSKNDAKFQQLEAKMEVMSKTTETLDDRVKKIETNNEEVSKFPDKIASVEADLATAKGGAESNKADIKRLLDVVALHEVKIQEMQSQVENLSYHSMKNNVIIHGIVCTKNEDCVAATKHFISQSLKITEDIDIAVAHRLGGTLRSPIIAKITKQSQKSLLFEDAAEKLKNQKNKYGDYLRISDQLPGGRQERNRRTREIIRDNNLCNPPQRLDLKKKSGTIYRQVTGLSTVASLRSLMLWMCSSGAAVD